MVDLVDTTAEGFEVDKVAELLGSLRHTGSGHMRKKRRATKRAGTAGRVDRILRRRHGHRLEQLLGWVRQVSCGASA
jgi:hypothetical protein